MIPAIAILYVSQSPMHGMATVMLRTLTTESFFCWSQRLVTQHCSSDYPRDEHERRLEILQPIHLLPQAS